jgi:hypothetical protein
LSGGCDVGVSLDFLDGLRQKRITSAIKMSTHAAVAIAISNIPVFANVLVEPEAPPVLLFVVVVHAVVWL